MRIAALALLLIVCNGHAEPVRHSPSADRAGGPAVFSISGQQASEVVTVVHFAKAYNAGRVDDAMALMADDVGGSDCDYRHATPLSFTGRQQTQDWLRERAADHDRLDIREVYNLNPDQPIGVASVGWARRSSDTLRALRLGDGIVPQLGAKVVFDRSGRIRSFANGPEGGSASFCRPAASVRAGASPTSPLPGQFDLTPRPYEVGSRWLPGLMTLIAFEDAYAAGNLEAALALLMQDVTMNDCDYVVGQVMDVKGKDEAARLLRAKLSDHDHRQVGQIRNESGESDVVGVVWASRASDSLRARGFAKGIRQQLQAKVVFSDGGGLIRNFANAGSGGPRTECRPTVAEGI
jgi:hypothetical protein